jgi:glycosyltransferase involved in cell wall biosynthesis
MEQICKSVVDGLIQKGHEVYVLTSRHGISEPEVDERIARLLYLEMRLEPFRNAVDFFLFEKKHKNQNLDHLKAVVKRFEPDVIFIWGMWNLPKILAQQSEQIMNGRVLYEFSDYWPALPSQHQLYWERPGKNRLTRAIRQLIRPIAIHRIEKESDILLKIPWSYCVSQPVKNHLIDLDISAVQKAVVIPTGIKLPEYSPNQDDTTDFEQKLPQLLFIGRLVQYKGLHVVLEALNQLRSEHPYKEWTLTVIGEGDKEYLLYLRKIIDNLNLNSAVNFLGFLTHARALEEMRAHGILLVPSLWEEPFATVAIEGMATGRLVIASDIGGFPEIIDHGTTGFLCHPGDAKEIADTIAQISGNPPLAYQMMNRAHMIANHKFSYDQMLEKIEQLLQQVLTGSSPTGQRE